MIQSLLQIIYSLMYKMLFLTVIDCDSECLRHTYWKLYTYEEIHSKRQPPDFLFFIVCMIIPGLELWKPNRKPKPALASFPPPLAPASC